MPVNCPGFLLREFSKARSTALDKLATDQKTFAMPFRLFDAYGSPSKLDANGDIAAYDYLFLGELKVI